MLSSHSMQQQCGISQLDCDMWSKVDFIWKQVQWLDWEEAPKHFPKPNLQQKKGHGHCLVVCCLSDPLQLSGSQQKHYIWEVYSANWWDALKTAMPAAGIGQQNGSNSSPWQHPTTHCTTNTSKVEQIGLQNFASSAVFTWPLANGLPLPQVSQLLFAFFKYLNCFLQGKWFHNQQKAEYAFHEFVKFQSTNFYARVMNKLISHWEKCVYCNGSYFD